VSNTYCVVYLFCFSLFGRDCMVVGATGKDDRFYAEIVTNITTRDSEYSCSFCCHLTLFILID
jgi:hypothetical protein